MKTFRSDAEAEVAEVFATLNSHPTGAGVTQFRSLASANQFVGLYALTALHAPPGSTVLDWGCGNGHFSFYLIRKGYRVKAYSFDQEPVIFQLLTPDERSRLEFISGDSADARTLPFSDAAFSCVFSVGVLEHVREFGGTEEGSLQEIRRVLQPGCAFVCYHFPNRYSYIEALARRLTWHHEYLFDAQKINALCTGAHMNPMDVRRYGVLPRNMFGNLPKSLRSSVALAKVVDILDLLLRPVFFKIAQNFSFVAIKSA
jgi:SAM-dependent methyltransferase